MGYYVADGSTQRGPFSIEQIAAQGLGPETLVWREGSPSWVSAGQVEELVRAGVVRGMNVPPPPPPSPPPGQAAYPLPPIPVASYASSRPYDPPYDPANSKRIAAGVCGILLGAFGIHKFILGFTASGVIMLLVTILSLPITCGLGWGVMGIIGLVEGIIYLTKTDEEFHYLYVVQKRDWF